MKLPLLHAPFMFKGAKRRRHALYFVYQFVDLEAKRHKIFPFYTSSTGESNIQWKYFQIHFVSLCCCILNWLELNINTTPAHCLLQSEADLKAKKKISNRKRKWKPICSPTAVHVYVWILLPGTQWWANSPHTVPFAVAEELPLYQGLSPLNLPVTRRLQSRKMTQLNIVMT